MSEYVVKVLEAKFITHDVKRFVVEKPVGYDFVPGQATDISINLPEWKDKLRPLPHLLPFLGIYTIEI